MAYLEEHNKVLIHPNRNLLLFSITLPDLLPLAFPICGSLGILDIQLLHLLYKTLSTACLRRASGLASGGPAKLLAPDPQRLVGTIQKRLHDGGVLAGVHARHLDIVGKEREVLKCHRLVLVIAHNIVHHVARREGLAVRGVTRKVETRGPVVGRIHDVEGVRSPATVSTTSFS